MSRTVENFTINIQIIAESFCLKKKKVALSWVRFELFNYEWKISLQWDGSKSVWLQQAAWSGCYIGQTIKKCCGVWHWTHKRIEIIVCAVNKWNNDVCNFQNSWKSLMNSIEPIFQLSPISGRLTKCVCSHRTIPIGSSHLTRSHDKIIELELVITI